ncbi:drug:proton antiporter [Actinorhabdospora filicis]|uniref:Drug:proton antiporter n=1 Tax=Actinorhabdospora filicis TaxID=1785913 RepID=A0A9W6SRN4_9ACTN|nr:geranylgeranyl reductase family protein [Actinorhabdospora filicis]GLZ80715.1 drug:proton antiporter [Actinorhabdospora filicis]
MTTTDTADVIVVGAGPAGSASAYYLARQGLDVLLLEKTEFPREKVCGDGLTPRSVRQLIRMGIDTSESAGWVRNRGLRVVTHKTTLEMDWPTMAAFPNYGLTRTRLDFDDLLAQRAVGAGARLLTATTVTEPVLDRAGRVVGVKGTHGKDRTPVEYRAPLVLSCDGVSGRLALALGIAKRDDRPIGVAVRRYYYCDVKQRDDYLESWLELRSAANPQVLLPGYGWIFGLGDGRINVGLGVLNSSSGFGKTDYRAMLKDWLNATPEEWGLRGEDNADGPIRGAALPMGFNRTPHYTRGLMLVGDSGGMVNPFNGEGIAYAMESGEMAAEIAAAALARKQGPQREEVLRRYPKELQQRLGGYYRLGGIFVKLIGDPRIMRLCTEHGLNHPQLMRFVLKLLANLTETRGGDLYDRVINTLSKAVPSA